MALMFEKGEPWRGEKAAYAFLWGRDRQAIPALVNCVCDESVYETIRGQAAEALIRLLPDPPAKDDRWPSAEAALLKGLDDPSPIVRFWCCFALGSLKSQKAIVPLEMLCRTDQALVRGWWYVHEEAEDALAMIAGRYSGDRIPVHMREAGAA